MPELPTIPDVDFERLPDGSLRLRLFDLIRRGFDTLVFSGVIEPEPEVPTGDERQHTSADHSTDYN